MDDDLLNEEGENGDNDFSDDSEVLKLQIIREIKDDLLISEQDKDKQISRLSKPEIAKSVTMQATDELLDFGFYEAYNTNYRVMQISLHGYGRKELVEITNNMAGSMDYSEVQNDFGKPTGWRGKVKNFFRKNY